MALTVDHVASATESIDNVQSLQDFCKDWQSKWRGIAIAAQGILKIFLPPAAAVIGFLISIADSFCAVPSGGKA